MVTFKQLMSRKYDGNGNFVLEVEDDKILDEEPKGLKRIFPENFSIAPTMGMSFIDKVRSNKKIGKPQKSKE